MGGNRGEKLVSVWKWSLKPNRRKILVLISSNIWLNFFFFNFFFLQLPPKRNSMKLNVQAMFFLFELPWLNWMRELCDKIHAIFQISWGLDLISATTDKESVMFSPSLQAWLTGVIRRRLRIHAFTDSHWITLTFTYDKNLIF